MIDPDYPYISRYINEYSIYGIKNVNDPSDTMLNYIFDYIQENDAGDLAAYLYSLSSDDIVKTYILLKYENISYYKNKNKNKGYWTIEGLEYHLKHTRYRNIV